MVLRLCKTLWQFHWHTQPHRGRSWLNETGEGGSGSTYYNKRNKTCFRKASEIFFYFFYGRSYSTVLAVMNFLCFVFGGCLAINWFFSPCQSKCLAWNHLIVFFEANLTLPFSFIWVHRFKCQAMSLGSHPRRLETNVLTSSMSVLPQTARSQPFFSISSHAFDSRPLAAFVLKTNLFSSRASLHERTRLVTFRAQLINKKNMSSGMRTHASESIHCKAFIDPQDHYVLA